MMTLDLRCKYSAVHRVAITGATGYAGSHLLSLYGEESFAPADFDDLPPGSLVVHLAANVSNSREALMENIAIDTHVFEQVNAQHRGLIYASTNNVYSFGLDCRVGDKLRYNDYYSAAKIFAEGLLEDRLAVPFVALRISDVFGVGQRHGNFFKAIEGAVRKRADLARYGAGLKRRTHIHVQELAGFIHWLTGTFDSVPTRTMLNIGYADSASVCEIVEYAAELTGLHIVEKLVENDRSSFDVRTMQTSFMAGYQPRWNSFREAFSSYIEAINSAVEHD